MCEMFKKVVAVIIAIYFFVFSCFIKTSAAMILAPAVEYLVPFLKTVLVASGMYAADELENMTDETILKCSGDLGKESADVIKKIATTVEVAEELDGVVNSIVAADAVDDSYLEGFELGSWISTHQDEVSTIMQYPGIDVQGASVLLIYDLGNRLHYMYGDRGNLTKNGSVNMHMTYFIERNSVGTITVEGSGDSYSSYTFYPGSMTLVGNWTYEDGTVADEAINTEGVEVPQSIGTVTIDGVDYPINADGTVTIDGNTIPINPDGTVTYNNQVYAPTYDITNVYNDDSDTDLITDLLNAIAELQIVTPDETTEELPVTETVLPDALAASDLAGFQVPSGITSVFPFCIPFDVYRGIKLLSAPPKAPYFEVPFEIPEIGVFPGYSTVIVLDFAKYDKYFKIVRWTMYLISVMGICFMSFKIVKGNT